MTGKGKGGKRGRAVGSDIVDAAVVVGAAEPNKKSKKKNDTAVVNTVIDTRSGEVENIDLSATMREIGRAHV